MKMDMSCVKTLWNQLCCSCRAIDRPVVRKRIDAEIGIYGDKNASKPIVSLDIDGDWTYKLSCVLKIVAVVLLVMWVCHCVSKWMHKIF